MSSSASRNPKTVPLLKTATHMFATPKNLPDSLLQEPGFDGFSANVTFNQFGAKLSL